MMSKRDDLFIWAIYNHPVQGKDSFTVRIWRIQSGAEEPIGSPFMHQTSTLDEARKIIPPGRYRLPRMEGDEPDVVETWL